MATSSDLHQVEEKQVADLCSGVALVSRVCFVLDVCFIETHTINKGEKIVIL